MSDALELLSQAVEVERGTLERWWATAKRCDYRWRDSVGGLHSCDMDRGIHAGRHYCACEASTEPIGSSLVPISETAFGKRTFPPPAGKTKTPEQSFEEYLRKAGGIPEAGAGSDRAVYDAAAWVKFNLPDMTEQGFVRGIRSHRPAFDERWILAKWKSAHR